MSQAAVQLELKAFKFTDLYKEGFLQTLLEGGGGLQFDISDRKQFNSTSDPLKSVQLSFLCHVDTVLLEPEILSKQGLVQVRLSYRFHGNSLL